MMSERALKSSGRRYSKPMSSKAARRRKLLFAAARTSRVSSASSTTHFNQGESSCATDRPVVQACSDNRNREARSLEP